MNEDGVNVDFWQESLDLLEQTSLSITNLSDRSRVKSYRHTNGFVKISLGMISTGEYCRLHYWPRGFGETNIHSHRWNFKSLLLYGAFRVSEYEVADEGLAMNAFLCSANNDGNYTFSDEKSCTLVESRSFVVRAGDSYGADAKTLHRVTGLSSQAALSVVVTGKTRFTDSWVYTDARTVPKNDAAAQVSGEDIAEIFSLAHAQVGKLIQAC